MTYFDDANEPEKSIMNKYIGQEKFKKLKLKKK